MSRRALRWALLPSLVALGLPAGGTAQQTDEELLLQIDSLLPLLEKAEQAAVLAQQRREETERRASAPATDTFMVGPLRIITVPDQRELAEEIYREVWDGEYAAIVGPRPQGSPAMVNHTFTFQWRRELLPIYVEGPVRRVEVPGWRTRAAVEETVRLGISNVLALDLGSSRVGQWSNGFVRVPVEPEEVYRNLALAPAQAARACFDGDPMACWLSLGLGIEDDEYPLDEWYSPEERVALVGQRGYRFARRETMPLWSACVEDGQISSCDTLLRDIIARWSGGAGQFAPLMNHARAALLWIALERGGEGAWDRLRADPEATPTEALLHASGVSAEELSRAWLDYVLAHQPASRAGWGSSLLLALMWIAAFAALAMRSTRWRLG